MGKEGSIISVVQVLGTHRKKDVAVGFNYGLIGDGLTADELFGTSIDDCC